MHIQRVERLYTKALTGFYAMERFNQVFLLGFILIWIAVFSTGVAYYEGSVVAYTVFSFVFLGVFLSGIVFQVSYGYLFMVMILWLGFWLKVTVHLFFNYPYGEPYGAFQINSLNAWDELLWLASLGAVGVLLARVLYAYVSKLPSTMVWSKKYKVPFWFVEHRFKLWSLLVLIIVSVTLLNLVFIFHQTGLVAVTQIWPLNTFFFWMLTAGLAMAVAMMIGWEISLKNDSTPFVYVLLFEAVSSSISLLSRGTFLFHSGPMLYAMFKNRSFLVGWTFKKVFILVLAFFMMFILVYTVTNTLRGYHYLSIPLEFSNVWFSGEGEGSFFHGMAVSDSMSRFLRMIVDRWIGIEGLMSVLAYPDKGWNLFYSALTEKLEIGSSDIYQEVCLSQYRYTDLTKYQFGSLPGPMAFLFYSGFTWFLVLGMFFLTLFVLFSESLIYKLIPNPLLTSFWGVIVANSIAQFGVAPRGMLLLFFLFSIGILFLYLVQKIPFRQDD